MTELYFLFMYAWRAGLGLSMWVLRKISGATLGKLLRPFGYFVLAIALAYRVI